MPVEFLGIAATNDGSEITARSGPIFEKEYTLRLARALERTAEQIESVRQAAKEAGRTDTPKIQVAFRPIIAPTEAQAWEKAHDIVARIQARVKASGALTRRRPIKNPENTGSQRLIAIAAD